MAEVKFRRIESSEDINNLPVVDGQIIYTKDGKQYIDYETERINMGPVSTNNGVILWTNSNPDSNFASQTITLSSSDYDMLLIIYKDVNPGVNLSSIYTIKGYGARLNKTFITTGSSGTTSSYMRTILYSTDTTYSVGDCISSSGNTANAYLIPLYIIGYNTGLFS